MSTTDRRRLIVTGATGKQGGAVISALLTKPSQPFEIYAVTRNKESEPAKSLASKPNVKVVQGDFDNPKAIFSQIQNPWGLFSVTTLQVGKKNAAEIEEQQGKAMNTAAFEAGITHVVYTSVDRGPDSDNTETPIPHFRAKKHVEDDIRQKAAKNNGTTWTLIRPVAFMDNIGKDFFGKVFVTMWRQNGLDTPLQLVSTKDIGRVAAEALLHADEVEYKNKAISLAGDSITPRQAAKIFRESTDQEPPSTFGILGSLTKMMMKDEVGTMFEWFKSTGYAADLQSLRSSYPFLKDFKAWVETESAWKKA